MVLAWGSNYDNTLFTEYRITAANSGLNCLRRHPFSQILNNDIPTSRKAAGD